MGRKRWVELWETLGEQFYFHCFGTCRCKDGTVFPVEITANSHEYNGLEFSICFFKDITEQKRERQRKDKANEQLQKTQKLEALGILAGGEGTGLGLSVVHGIIKSHGGATRVYSELDVGTTFHVLFPMEETTAEAPPQTFESLPNGNECLLLVDDEELLLNLGKEFLEGLGYQVETRASSIDAFEAVRARPEKYDLIISDLTMPHMPGDIFAKEVKKLRPNLPVILCTGYSDRIDQEAFREI